MYNISSLLTPNLLNLRKIFQSEGFDIRFVGGCVRDIIMGVPHKDVDICTDANPDEQIALYNKHGIRYAETGISHGTILVQLDDGYEITSLRKDVTTDGRHATVEYSKDWIEDLARRDFTINAMSFTFDGELIDEFDGVLHINLKELHFVGAAEDRIKEDYLRILRWFRFKARFQWPMKVVSFHVLTVISNHSNGLKKVSAERHWMEISKIASYPNAYKNFYTMSSPFSGLDEFFPPWDDGVSEKYINAVQELTNNPITVLVAIYGKALMNQLRKWKCSSAEIKLAAWLIDAHNDKLSPMREMAVNKVSREWAIELGALNLVDPLGMTMIKTWEVPTFPINGYDVMNAGVTQGIQIRILLRDLITEWADSNYALTRDDLLDRLHNALK
jgi:tRNA nucleotidyltransferase/poly(A) polymerase